MPGTRTLNDLSKVKSFKFTGVGSCDYDSSAQQACGAPGPSRCQFDVDLDTPDYDNYNFELEKIVKKKIVFSILRLE
jgi:hypothetical protein